MYTIFSRLPLNAQNMKNALDYAEKYCYSFHLSLLRCQNIINDHITFTESELGDEKSISDIIPIDEEEFEVLIESLTKLIGMSFTYEKLHDIIDDLVGIYYDKTYDDAFMEMRKSYRYVCANGENYEVLRRLYIEKHSEMILCASELMNSMQDGQNSLVELKEYIETHKDEAVRKELDRIMKSSLEDWKMVFREYI